MALWLDRLVVLSVVSPSATVGWMPTVRSKSAFVAPCLGLGVGLGLGFRVRVRVGDRVRIRVRVRVRIRVRVRVRVRVS